MKRLLPLLFILITSFAAFGQGGTTPSPAQTLRLARATYEQGRLHEVPAQLNDAIIAQMTELEKVQAYTLLCLSYIYLEEADKADQNMLHILETDPYFEPNPAVDPAEFVALYRTFRTDPILSVGAFFGANATFPTLAENYAIGGQASGKGTYSTKVGIQFGLAFEKILFKRIIAAPEVLLSTRSFLYDNPKLFVFDDTGNPSASQTGEIKLSYLDLNLLFQYKLLKGKSTLNPYVTIGPGIGFLLSAENTAETQYTNGQVTSGPPIDFTDNCNPIGFSVIAGGGVKYKFGGIYIIANIRYQYGLNKVVDAKKRSNPEATFDYIINPNVYGQQNVAANIGFIYPIFKPKKLTK